MVTSNVNFAISCVYEPVRTGFLATHVIHITYPNYESHAEITERGVVVRTKAKEGNFTMSWVGPSIEGPSVKE